MRSFAYRNQIHQTVDAIIDATVMTIRIGTHSASASPPRAVRPQSARHVVLEQIVDGIPIYVGSTVLWYWKHANTSGPDAIQHAMNENDLKYADPTTPVARYEAIGRATRRHDARPTNPGRPA